MTDRIELTRPDDWHLHLRDGPVLHDVVAATARVFARAIVMPNLRPPVTATAQAAAYRQRIVEAVPRGAAFTPLMTLYLTDNTDAPEIARAAASGFVHAVKYYPMGATTHSDAGVTALERVYPALAAMEKHGLVLSLHGEVTDPDVDMFDRERVFVDRLLQRIVRGLRPHHYCLPILKRETHRQALVSAAGHVGQPEVLPRHRQCPARETHEGTCLRLRRLLLGARGDRALRRGLRRCRRARAPRRLRQLPRRRLLPAAAQHRQDRARPRAVERAGRLPIRRRHRRAAARGRSGALAPGHCLNGIAPGFLRAARMLCCAPKPARPSPPSFARGEESPGSTEQDAG